jgi:hypothetical protein
MNLTNIKEPSTRIVTQLLTLLVSSHDLVFMAKLPRDIC